MSLLIFRSGHVYQASSVDRIEPYITVRRRTELTVSQPEQVVIGGDAVHAVLNTTVEVDVDHVMYPKSSGKREVEPVVVSRNICAVTKTINGVELLKHSKVLEEPTLRAEVVNDMRRLDRYYNQLGSLSAPAPAENSLIAEATVALNPETVESNIRKRTKALMKRLVQSGIIGETASDPYTDIYAVLDDCPELTIDDLLPAVINSPIEGVIGGSASHADAAE